MNKIAIYFGSDYGTTENISNSIKDNLEKLDNKFNIDIYNINNVNVDDFNKYDVILLGTSTSYYGELQSDWEDFLPKLKDINFKEKLVAFFGCGNQEDYPECFCDGIGILYDNLVKHHENIKLIGLWNKNEKEYKFTSSKALSKDNENKFLGLIIDDDNQPDLTDNRIETWCKQINEEIKNNSKS